MTANQPGEPGHVTPPPAGISSDSLNDNSYRSAPHRRFSIHVAGTLATRLSMAVISVVSGVIITRWLGAAKFGAFAVLNVTVATAVQIGSAGLPSASVYFISQDRRNLPYIAAISLTFAVIAGGLLASGMIALAVRGSALFGEIPVAVVTTAAISIPFQLATLLGLNVLLGLGQIRRFNLLDAAGQLMTLLNGLIALVLFGAGLFALVSLNTAAGVLVSVAIACLIGQQIASKGHRLAVRPAARLFARMAGYSLKFHVSIVLGMLIVRADLLIVEYFRGAAEAGVYAVASQAAMMLMLLPGVIGTLLFQRVASVRDPRGEITCFVTRHAAFVMLMMCIASVPTSFLLPVLYGESFADSTVQFLLLLPGVYLISIETILVQHFTGTGFPVAIPLFWTATFAVNLALNLSLVPSFGARGAAFASAISYAMIFVMVAVYFRARTGHGISAVLFLRASELRGLRKIADFGGMPGGEG